MTKDTTPTARPESGITASAPDFGCGWSLTHLLGALSLRAEAGRSDPEWPDRGRFDSSWPDAGCPDLPDPAPAGRATERVAHAS